MRADRRRAWCLVAVASSAFVLTTSTRARADEKQACVAASEQAQQQRTEGKARAARESLLVCARETCPAVIRKDCAQWLTEVEAGLPSIVINARDAQGHDVVAVKVTVDGAPFTDKLEGKALAIDAGVHNFHFEMDGAPPVEEKVVVHEGEKNRNLAVTFKTPGPPQPAVLPAPPPPAPVAEAHAGPPALAYVLAGVGVVALGSFTYFGLKGKGDASTLRNGCGVTASCAQSDVDAVKSKLLIADISLAVGVVSLGVATYLFIARPSEPKAAVTTGSGGAWISSPSFDVKALPGGGVAALGGQF